MKRKLLVFIAIIVIPFVILILDRYVFNEDIPINASYDNSHAWKQIIKHKNEYPTSLLKLANSNKETIPFVANYLEDHNKDFSLDLNEDLKQEGVPLLLQWDKRWGYKIYGDDMMAINGCGPTCLSMVASYLKQNPQYNPYCIAKIAYKKGYFTSHGTSWRLMNEGAKLLGLQAKELPLSESVMIQELQNDHPIICSMSKGTFTTTGHFIVIKSYKDGKFYVNDPNSQERSRDYTYQELSYQIKNLWSYSV